MDLKKHLDLQTLKKSLLDICRKNKDKIFDIIIFGSAVKGREDFNDIDVAVIFKIKDETILAEIKKIDETIHTNYVMLEEIYTEELWKTLIQEGFSISANKNLSSTLGMESYGLFTYNLTKVKRKARFSQILAGYKSEPILKKVDGKILKPGVALIPVEKIELFRKFLEVWEVDYTFKSIYIT